MNTKLFMHSTKLIALFVILALLPSMAALAAPAEGVALLPPTTVFVDDDYTIDSAGGHDFGVDAFDNLQDAVDAVASGGYIYMEPGEYHEPRIVIEKNIYVYGSTVNPTTIYPNANFTGSGEASAWFFVEESFQFYLYDVMLDGGGFNVEQAIRSHGHTWIENVSFQNIVSSTNPYVGIAVSSFGGIVAGGAGSDSHSGAGGAAGTLTVKDSDFQNIGRIGVLVKGTLAGATITGNTYTGKGDGNWLDYAFEVGAGGSATIDGNTAMGNTGVALSDGSTSAGILVTTYFGSGTQATIENNGLTGNSAGIAIGYDENDTSVVMATGNNFADNKEQVFATADGLFDVVETLANNTFDQAVTVDHPGSSLLPAIWSSIQDGVDAAVAGDMVDVAAGTYEEDVNINKSLTLHGAGAASTTIWGISGGDGATVRVAASGVEVSGFTITRLGNNPTDWNDPGLNFAGIAIQGTALTGMNIHDNILTGNRTGIDINNSPGHIISDNLITDNRTGMILRNQTDNLTVTGNEITNNWTLGVLFLDGSGGTNSPLQQALNSTFANNDISGNWYGQVVDRQTGGSLPAPGTTNLKNFTNNWWGIVTPVVSTADSTEPGYSSLIPVAYGGSAVPPGGQPDILGTASANITYNPRWLNAEMTLSSGTAPTTVYVDDDFPTGLPAGRVFGYDAFATIQEGVDAVDANGTVNVAAGLYPEQVSISKSLHLVGAGVGSSTIQAPATLPAASQPGSNIILVSGSGVDAEITGFTITGPGPSGCGSIRAGIFVRDSANANIHHNTIQDIRDSTFSGCQNGAAIFVGRQLWSTSGTATIANNTIVGYQKGGIVVDNTGSSATITNNTVTGVGTTTIIAQNGIQISRGATATLSGNTVTGNSFHVEGNPWDWASAGVLIFESGSAALTGGNTVTGNDQNVYNDGGAALTLGVETIGSSTAPVDKGYDIINSASYAVDATGVTFVGSADNFAIEDRVWHVIDQAGLGLVTWVPNNVYISSATYQAGSIQRGVDASSAGGTVNLAAGTYTENPNINKSLILSGPNAGIDPNTGTRVPEAVLQGEVTVGAGSVTIDGLTITNPSGKHGITASDQSGVHISNNIINDIGSADTTTSGSNYGIAVVSTSAAVNDAVIRNNLITNVVGGNFKSAQAIAVGWSNGVHDITGLLIQNNVISNINSSTLDYAAGGRGAYGVILNHGTGGGSTISPQILDNQISSLEGLWAHGIGLEGNTPMAIVRGNTIDNLTDHKSPADPDAAAVMVEDNASADQVFINENSFTNTLLGVRNDTALNVNAERNWWGSAYPVWPSIVSENVSYAPWCGDAACSFLNQPAGAGIYDDRHAAWQYSGNWAQQNTTGPYQGTFTYSQAVDDFAFFTFEGNMVTLYYTQYTNRGEMNIYIDDFDTPVGTINANGPLSWQKSWTSDPLTPGVHTVQVTYVSGTMIDVDAIRVSTPMPEGMYDDRDAAWQYNGSWAQQNTTGPYQGTFTYSQAANNFATFSFEGKRFTLYYTQYTNRGEMDIYIDDMNTPVHTIDANGSLIWRKSWTSDLLTPGVHTVKIVHVSGTYIDVDAIQTFASSDSVAPNAIADLTAVTGTATGTVRLNWTAVGDDADTGAATAYLVKYSAAAITDETDWTNATTLTTGITTPQEAGQSESLVVSGLVPGRTYYFAVRAEDEEPNLGGLSNSPSATAKSPTPMTAGIYDDRHAAWQYSGSWGRQSATGPYNGTFTYSPTVNDSVTFTFEGNRFTLYYTQYINRGEMDIYIDDFDTPVGTINANGALAWQKTWTSDLLTPGVHTVKIVHVSGTYIDVDAIRIFRPMPAGTYDDRDAGWRYTGSWAQQNTTGPYKSTFTYSQATNDSATFSFEGSQVTLYYTQYTNRGVMNIYIDDFDTPVATIDANGSLVWQQSWTSAPLTPGVHTLKIVHVSGTYIDVDAIKIYP